MKVNTLKLLEHDRRVFFIAGDWHLPEEDPAAVSILIQHAKLIPFDDRYLIINGDLLDLAFLMRKHALFNMWISHGKGVDEYFLVEFNKVIDRANKLLDELAKVFPSIIFGFGNHETKRVHEFLELISQDCRHNFDISVRLHLKERGIFSFPYNTYLDIGDLAITHGQLCGANVLAKHFHQCGKSVLVSHLHTAMTHSFEARERTYHAYSTGAMCKMPSAESAKYMEWRDNRWCSGYVTVMTNSGAHFLNHHTIIDGCLKLSTGEVLYGK